MLKCAAVFSDHMVLQRGKPIPVWGSADPSAAVTVMLGGLTASACADGEGRWAAVLPSMDSGEGLTLTVGSGGERLDYSDVVLGEVWLAGGQSNMEMALRDCAGGRREVSGSASHRVRFYKVPRCPVAGPELEDAESRACWQLSSPETAGDLSAVAWFFACRIEESRDVTVGVIDCCWGGTSVTCWMSRERLESTSAGRSYIDAYAALVNGKSEAQYRLEMEEYNALWSAWNSRVEALRAERPHVAWEEINRTCGLCPWPQPAGEQSPFRPAGLYETMLSRVAPYGLRGFIFYQGEEDADRFASYGRLLTDLIDQWRTDWRDVELPFLFVQLPMYCDSQSYAQHLDNKHWAMLREQQERVSLTVANTGMAVMIDGGEFDNIHPLDKRTVGDRLALLARSRVYGEPVVAQGPRVHRVVIDGNRVTVRFDGTAGSLKITGNYLDGFELAGPDDVYYEARADLGLDTVTLTSDHVPQPVTVRYAWTNYGQAGLLNAAGLPAAPFRTDSQEII